jgi:hypothetical protein
MNDTMGPLYSALAQTWQAQSATALASRAAPSFQAALDDAVDAGRFAEARVVLSELERENPRWRDAVRTMSLHPEGEAFARFLAETDPTGDAEPQALPER